MRLWTVPAWSSSAWGVDPVLDSPLMSQSSPPPDCWRPPCTCGLHDLAKTLALITVDRIEQATGQRSHRSPGPERA